MVQINLREYVLACVTAAMLVIAVSQCWRAEALLESQRNCALGLLRSGEARYSPLPDGRYGVVSNKGVTIYAGPR